MKSKLKLILKLLFVFGLLYFLVKKGFISIADTRHAILQWRYSLPGLCCLLLTSFLGVVRWNLLLKAHGIRLPFRRIFQVVYIGLFFNIALPGAVSGDLIKAFYVGKEAQGHRTKAFGSILFDRVAGLSALVILSASACLFDMAAFGDSHVFRALRVVLTIAASAVIAFYSYLFLVREHHDPLLLILKRIETKVPKLAIAARLYEALRHYHNHRLTVLKVLGISLLIHLVVGWAYLQFAHALGQSQIALLPVYMVVPIGLLVTAIPVLPAGVGTGHAAFLYLFGLLGSRQGANIFSIAALIQIFIGSIGGVIYLRFRSVEPTATIEATT